MKKIYILFILLLLTGCNSEPQQQAEPEYQKETTETENLGNLMETEKQETEDLSDTEEVTFHGIDSKEEMPLFEIQNVNNRYAFGENYFCHDPETGISYYINYGGDNYLYSLNGNKKTLVLDKFVSCINVRDNVLYFIYTEDTEQYSPFIQLSYTGGLYSYDLETKKMTCLSKEDIGWILVVQNGIYGRFPFNTKKYENRAYFYSFDTKTWEPAFQKDEKMEEYSFCLYKDYHLKRILNQDREYQKTVWRREADGKELPFLGKKQILNDSGEFIYGDHFYCRIRHNEKEPGALYMIDLTNGKQYQYKMEDGTPLISPYRCVEIDGKTYMASDTHGEIFVGDTDSGVVRAVQIKGPRHWYERLYTDGKRLFALSGQGDYHMVELLLSENGIREVNIGSGK